MNELHLFAGAGGGILGGILLGHTCVCAVEIEPYCRKVLLQRQRDGILPRFPIWDDVRTFDGKPWRGLVDVVCGGFPCQDISIAGRGTGITGERSGLWGEMARVVREVEPGIVFVENSAAITFRGLGRVLADLAEMGYDARWGVFSAADVGARHQRERMWLFANAACERCREARKLRREQPAQRIASGCQETTYSNLCRCKEYRPKQFFTVQSPQNFITTAEPGIQRASDGVAEWHDRLAAIGNGQVPAVVKLAWETLALPNAEVTAKS